MVVLIVENAQPSLRGEISRLMIQPRAGTFVGNIPARVRDRLWDHVTEKLTGREGAGAMLIHSARTEQGFAIRAFGDPRRKVVDVDGLQLIKFSGV
ncbi:MAG: type I-E CRISPR-associated endoribonuclease Cas2e [Armatimonadota bacterium]|jgi:CRISPR-associated protein Cas2